MGIEGEESNGEIFETIITLNFPNLTLKTIGPAGSEITKQLKCQQNYM